MGSIARGPARLRLAAPLLAAAIACSGGGGGGSGDGPFVPPVREQARLSAPPVTPSLPLSEGGASEGALTCAGTGEIVCGSVCCPAGTACVNGASSPECHLTVNVQGCPAEAPLACDEAVSCAAGCTAFDESGRGNHLAISAPAGFGEGRSGGGFYVNRIAYGTPEQLATAPGADVLVDRATIEAWIRPGQYLDPGDWQAIFSHGSRSLQVAPRGITFAGCTVDLGPLRTDGTGDPLGPGLGWKFLAVTVDGSSIRFYLDSRPSGSCAYSGPAFDETWGQIRVGTNVNPTASYSKYQFQGGIDELRVLDLARSDAEIIADYELPRLPAIAGTRALWRFDEGSRRRCCPAGTTCDAGGRCELAGAPRTCPETEPVQCDGFCCPDGTSCGSGACVVPGASPGCALSCGDGSCCPAGYHCGSSSCVVDPGPSTANPCGAGKVAVDGGDGALRCCAEPGPGIWVGFVDVSTGDPCWGCYTGPIPSYTGCPPGYASCGGKCIRQPEPPGAVSCGAGEALCGGNTQERPGGCCEPGGVCTGNGECCPGGATACGGAPCVSCGGTCCSQAQCDAGTCAVPKVACATGTLCGTTCCPDGTTCSEGSCLATTTPEVSCAPGVACGATCCAEGESCVSPGVCERAPAPPPACPPELPVACGGGVGCCPADHACPTWDGDVCRYVGTTAATSGPTGPRCSDTTACGAAQVCTGSGCCPADHPLACGTSCCLPGAACVSGACACPDGRAACNGTCCGSGMSCVNGACTADCADPAFPLTCGEFCCSEKYSCVSGDCACRGDHPVTCGDGCCLAGATCGDTGCGCPAETPTSCGEYCCAPGQQCLQCPGQSAPSCRDTPCPLDCPGGSHQSGSVCVCDTPGHWVSTCPGGAKKCCLNGMTCCYGIFGGAADCTPDAWCN